MLYHIKTDFNRSLKKKYDCNPIVKNIRNKLYAVKKNLVKGLYNTEVHTKCLKYSFAKDEGDKTRTEENKRAIIPHQIGDHSSCHPR